MEKKKGKETGMNVDMDTDMEQEQVMSDWLRTIQTEAPDRLRAECQELEQLVQGLEETSRKSQENRRKLVNHVCGEMDIPGAGDMKHVDRMDLVRGKMNKERLELEQLNARLTQRKEEKAAVIVKVKEADARFERLNGEKKDLERKEEALRVGLPKKEYNALSKLMRVTYRSDSMGRVIGIMHNGKNGVEKFFHVDKENNPQQEQTESFWQSLDRCSKSGV
jgi:hypothetical protein